MVDDQWQQVIIVSENYNCYLVVIAASEDPEVQTSFQKLKTEHDELESDFVLMSKMEVMTKGLKKSYEVTPAMMQLYLY